MTFCKQMPGNTHLYCQETQLHGEEVFSKTHQLCQEIHLYDLENVLINALVLPRNTHLKCQETHLHC
jgi:hypothetical protein